VSAGGKLEERLAAPALEDRLAALAQLCSGAEARSRRGVNLHLHTNYSFSSFRSPCEAVWQGVREGIAVLGINDHYAVDGHEEFRRACEIAGLPATLSMEAVAMDRECEAAGMLVNDPANPGRAYLSAKGITRYPRDGEPGATQLAGLRAALEERNREMTARVGRIYRERLGADGPGWEDVVGLTPANNTTERHIARAVYLDLVERAGEGGQSSLLELIEKLAAARPEQPDPTSLQGFIRAKLLKAGGPCYVEERPEAFLSFEEMRETYLAFGAIPAYPVLLDPVTEFEADVAGLLDWLGARGWLALEVIPFRNSRERLSALVGAARERSWPVFTGTEHNTPEPKPLLDKYSLDPEFEEWFAESALVLLGHQAERAAARDGFVDDAGRPAIADAAKRFEHFREAGRLAAVT
jgi:hypothetical protein